MRYMLSAACGLAMACSAVMRADAEDLMPAIAPEAQSRVVVELFTSQGCEFCPPADEFFASLAADPGVIALALHVDYWDYIGWEDSFGDARFTERQKAYARDIGSRTVYTPQFIVGGVERISGVDPEATFAALSAHGKAKSPVTLSVTREGDNLIIRALADPPLSAPVRVELVRYQPEATVNIERGSNIGKAVSYRNIVTDWETLGDWAGIEPLAVTVPAPGDAPAVIIVQDIGARGEGQGRILAAAAD